VNSPLTNCHEEHERIGSTVEGNRRLPQPGRRRCSDGEAGRHAVHRHLHDRWAPFTRSAELDAWTESRISNVARRHIAGAQPSAQGRAGAAIVDPGASIGATLASGGLAPRREGFGGPSPARFQTVTDFDGVEQAYDLAMGASWRFSRTATGRWME
jgi:hypothetical protein